MRMLSPAPDTLELQQHQPNRAEELLSLFHQQKIHLCKAEVIIRLGVPPPPSKPKKPRGSKKPSPAPTQARSGKASKSRVEGSRDATDVTRSVKSPPPTEVETSGVYDSIVEPLQAATRILASYYDDDDEGLLERVSESPLTVSVNPFHFRVPFTTLKCL